MFRLILTEFLLFLQPQQQQQVISNRNTVQPLSDNRAKTESFVVQLTLFYHAMVCRQRKQCIIASECTAMKDLHSHMNICKVNKDCSVSRCSTTKAITDHWKNCSQSDCQMCLPLRQCRFANYLHPKMSYLEARVVNKPVREKRTYERVSRFMYR